jgi:hypothetical protein
MSNILLIAPNYYNYHKLIQEALISNGNTVDFIADKNSGIEYIIASKSSFLLNIYRRKYKKEILNILNNYSYDYLIVIGGKTLDYDLWKEILEPFNFKKILYQWDSLNNFNYQSLIPLFDKVITFDRKDSKLLNIPYLPLFFKKEDDFTLEDIDILFVGIWHSDRLRILNKVYKDAKNRGLKCYFKLYYPLIPYLYLRFIKKLDLKSDFFIFKSIPLEETQMLYKRSKCILDIAHPKQSGLTMRTIETIGNGKKLITTNRYIKEEDFYNNSVINIIERDDIFIDKNLFKNNEYSVNIDHLEINNWVKNFIDE